MHEHELQEQILARLESIDQKADQIMSAQEDINAAVTALNEFLPDVVTLLNGLAASGEDADTSKLNALVSQLPALQAEVVAATPAPASSTPPSSSTPPASSAPATPQFLS
jgi:hypothetical protein